MPFENPSLPRLTVKQTKLAQPDSVEYALGEFSLPYFTCTTIML